MRNLGERGPPSSFRKGLPHSLARIRQVHLSCGRTKPFSATLPSCIQGAAASQRNLRQDGAKTGPELEPSEP